MAELTKSTPEQRAKHHEFMLNILQSTFDTLYAHHGPAAVTECAMATIRAYLEVIGSDWPMQHATFSDPERTWSVRPETVSWKTQAEEVPWEEEDEEQSS